MKVQSTILGEIEVNESELLIFENGLPGFENEKNFILQAVEGNEVFQILQSTESKEVGFVTANPYLFTEDYNFELDEATVEALQIESAEDVIVVAIVTVKDPFQTSTINLKAPVVINTQNRKAKQCILEKSDYPIRHSIESKTNGKEG